jgi:hypothetical protein
LGELYDGHITQGTWSITSTQPPQNLDDREQLNILTGIEEGDHNQLQEEDAKLEEDDVVIVERIEQRLPSRSDAPTTNQEKVERTEQRPPRRSDAPTINQQKEAKRMKKEALEGLVGRYLDMKTKQVEDEAAQLEKEKEVVQDNGFSIKRYITILRTMDVTVDEKIKAAEVFNIPNNRETFMCFNDDEPKTALLCLRGKMDKL